VAGNYFFVKNNEAVTGTAIVEHEPAEYMADIGGV
jgi:hypothetical protein